MALSQCLDDSPLRLCPKRTGADDLNLQEVYNERHRLALEELLSGGLDHFQDFLAKERIPNFLSDDEIRRIRSTAVPPRCVSVHGDDQLLEQSLGSSLDCSSVTYFPEVSDVEPPVLEMGWPAFTAGSYRGVTRAVAHFRPSYGECIYSCKEAARRLIKSAREVIAIVTDSLTDLDIFKDLQEACTQRRVPVYILLDQLGAPSFLKMCGDVGVRLDDFWEEILAGSTIRCFPAEQLPVNEPVIPSTVSCHASTQTRKSVTDRVARPGSARRHLEGLLPQADQGPSAPLLHCHRGESWRTSPT